MSGCALATISGLTLSSAKDREAINLLKNSFGNPQVQIPAHIKIKRVKFMDNVELLRKLYNDIEICVRNLKTLDAPTHTYGSLLLPILNERIPEE